MGVYRPMTSLLYRAARENASRAARHRLDEPARLSLSMVASLQPASVSPGKFIVAPPRHAILNFRFAASLAHDRHRSVSSGLFLPPHSVHADC